MRLAIVFLLLLTVPALSEEIAGNANGRTEINGGFRTNTINGVRVWRPFPPAPAPVVVAPPPAPNVVINQAAPAGEPTVALPIYVPRYHRQRPHFQPPRRRPARHQMPTPGRSGRSQWHNER